MAQVFDFTDYIDFLKTEFSGEGPKRGSRIKLATHLNCQPTFITQVLSRKVHISFEYAYSISEYLQLSPAEIDYFILLVHKGRAGSIKLERYYNNKISMIQKERESIKNRINVKTDLSLEDQMKYYSKWYYSSIHILTSIPGYQNAESISQRLHLDLPTTKEALDFLTNKGFVQINNNEYHIGSRRIHLKQGSDMLPKHHSNWRIKAIESVDNEKADDLHYTAVLGIAKKDKEIFKSKLLQLLEDLEPTVIASEQDTQVILLLDLFEK